MDGVKGVFISHLFNDGDDYEIILNAITQACPFDFHNYSCTYNYPLYMLGIRHPLYDVKKKVRNRIKSSSLFIVVLNYYADYSLWMKYELQQAVRYQLPMIGIWPHQRTHQLRSLQHLDMIFHLDDNNLAPAICRYLTQQWS